MLFLPESLGFDTLRHEKLVPQLLNRRMIKYLLFGSRFVDASRVPLLASTPGFLVGL